MNLFDDLAKIGATGIVAIVWVVAIFSIFMAASQANDYAANTATATMLQSSLPRPLRIQEQKMNADEYREVATVVGRRYNSVRFTVSRNGLTVAAQNLENYSAWVAALYDVMASRADIRWQVTQLCAGSDCRGAPFSAELEALQKKPAN